MEYKKLSTQKNTINSMVECTDSLLCSTFCTLRAVTSTWYPSPPCSPWTSVLETYSWSLRNFHGSFHLWKAHWGWHSVGHSGCPATGHSHGYWKIVQENKTRKVRASICGTFRNLHQESQPRLRQRILYDASQQPIVVSSMPDLISLLGDCGCPLLILPKGVQL